MFVSFWGTPGGRGVDILVFFPCYGGHHFYYWMKDVIYKMAADGKPHAVN